MSLQIIDKPNLYFAAQLLINNLLAKIVEGHVINNQIQYHLFELKKVFRDNVASTTTHLEAIADLTRTYMVLHNETNEEDGIPFITSFSINGENNTVTIGLNPQAIELVKGRDFQIKAID